MIATSVHHRRARAARGCGYRIVLALLLAGLSTLVAAQEPTAVGSQESAALDQLRQVSARAYEQQVKPLLAIYCVSCHGPEKHKGDIDFAALATGMAALADKATWTTCAGKLRSREMPPEKERTQPSDAERDAILSWIASLKRLAPRDPGPGIIRRLSRVEYANTLHDLLGVDPKVAADLPNDTVGEGYNSTISPLLMEKYLLVADEVLDQLIKPDQMSLSWKAGQLDAIIERKSEEGRPEGAERRLSGPCEITAVIPAPVDGTYTIKLRAAAERSTSKEPARLALRVDGQVIGEVKVTASPKFPASYSVSCKLSAGKAHLSLLMANPFVEDAAAPAASKSSPPAPAPAPAPASSKPSADKTPAKAAAGREVRTVVLETVEVTGPPAGVPSEAQRKLFVAVPGKDLAKRDAARRIAEAFARRAYRRPPAPEELELLLKVFDLADGQEEVFSEAVKLMLKAVLVSPEFLFLTPDEGSGTGAGIVALGDYQLASRLSYLLWATMPDEELAGLAANGTLHQAAVIAAQVRRLVADPRSHALFDGFGAPWLGLDKLADQPFDEKKFPLMTREMRAAMYTEAAMLFDGILREDLSVITLLDCDYTYLNQQLARLYGLEAEVKGPQWRKVALSDPNRGGVLTMPGILAVTSLPNRTSPVKRGRWVLEQILGQNPPPPPMNVPPLEKQDTSENAVLNLRSRTERHRSDPACAGCHRVLDPIGFGLENFDPLGRWREKDDTGVAVDAVGELPGKVAFRTPKELKAIIAGHRDEVCHTLVAKLLAYTLCHHLESYDEVVADEISAAVAKDGYRFQTLLIRIATSYPFLNRHLVH
jgi:mono/diheme cytochrome c family protein